MTTKIRGRHRRQGQRAAVMGALPIAIAISYSSVAVAAPQPGVTDEAQPDDDNAPSTAQPGVTPESDSEKAAPSTERTKESKPKSYWVAPPVEYNNVPTREVPTYYDYSEEEAQYVAPEQVQVQELHLPKDVEPVAPIEAPEDKLRIGDYVSEKPEWLSQEDMEKTNNTAAVAEAQMATFWNSVGVDGSRSDLVAGATIAGAAVGGVTGAAVVGIPVAVVAGVVASAPGCAAGGTAAGILGAAGTIPAGGIGGIPAATIGCGVGAAAASAGASALAGIPAAAVGGTVGAVIGGVAGAVGGATYETLNPDINPDVPVEPGEKAKPEAEDAPEAEVAPAPPVEAAPPAPVEAGPQAFGLDTQMITDTTRNVVSQVEALPGGSAVVNDLRAFINGPGTALADDAEAAGNAVGAGVLV